MNPPPTSGSNVAAGKAEDDFSLVLGGPLYQLLRKAHLSGDALELLVQRVVVIAAIAWLPLLVLSVWTGQALPGGPDKVPFLLDVEVHVRFLVALPLLIAAELVVHGRMRTVVRQFRERDLIAPVDVPRFEAAITSALRLRNSMTAELLLLAFVYVIGVMVVWRHTMVLDATTWYAAPNATDLHPSLAGAWFGFVSLPIFQFLLLRWYFRLFIWTRFLWQVSRLDLRLSPGHPDRLGGLGFLSGIILAFTPLLLAHGAFLSGVIANRIFFVDATLPAFKMEIGAVVVIMLLMVLGPLLVFAPVLATVKRTAKREYGVLATNYVRQFETKWLRGGAVEGEPLLGSADIQSLADLNNSFEVVSGMRIVPFTREMIVQLVAVVLAPVAPLMLTMIPLEELLKQLVSLVF